MVFPLEAGNEKNTIGPPQCCVLSSAWEDMEAETTRENNFMLGVGVASFTYEKTLICRPHNDDDGTTAGPISD